MLGCVHRGHPTMILHSIKSGSFVITVISCGHYVFGINKFCKISLCIFYSQKMFWNLLTIYICNHFRADGTWRRDRRCGASPESSCAAGCHHAPLSNLNLATSTQMAPSFLVQPFGYAAHAVTLEQSRGGERLLKQRPYLNGKRITQHPVTVSAGKRCNPQHDRDCNCRTTFVSTASAVAYVNKSHESPTASTQHRHLHQEQVTVTIAWTLTCHSVQKQVIHICMHSSRGRGRCVVTNTLVVKGDSSRTLLLLTGSSLVLLPHKYRFGARPDVCPFCRWRTLARNMMTSCS